MIKELMKHNIKENKVHFISILLIIMLYGSISVAMFDPSPDGLEAFQQMIDQMPESMINIFGFQNLNGPMVSYISNYLYGFIMIIFPIIYIILVGNRLVVRHIDKGSMVYILTMPYTRKRIITNQALFFVLSFIIIFVVNVGVVIGMSEIMFKGLLDIKLYLVLNFIALSVHLFMMGITFLISVIISDFQLSSGVTSGLLITTAVFNMLARLGDKVEFLKYLTPYSIVNVDYILEGNGNGVLGGIIMLILAIIVFVSSIKYFDRKSIII